jgi:hypothetical protein
VAKSWLCASLRVVCPFTQVQPETWDALERYAPNAEFVRMDSDTSYYNLMATLWQGDGSLLVVEHDVVIHEHVIPEFSTCPQSWCSFPYSGGYVLFDEGLGCARFSFSLLRRLPHLIADITDRHWSSLDSRIADSLRAAGHKVHVHGPPVGHAHRWRPPAAHLQPCPCPTCVWVAGVIP